MSIPFCVKLTSVAGMMIGCAGLGGGDRPRCWLWLRRRSGLGWRPGAERLRLRRWLRWWLAERSSVRGAGGWLLEGRPMWGGSARGT